jgi:hypothetical protein
VEKDVLDIVEADSYWCLSKLVDGLQDNYTTSQPGIQRQVYKLKELIGRIDGLNAANFSSLLSSISSLSSSGFLILILTGSIGPLMEHIQSQGIEFLQFSFRWMNCLLMRETTLKNIIRMWDTYMAEGVDGFSVFHLYVCAAFLISWAKDVKRMDFAVRDSLFPPILSRFLNLLLFSNAIIIIIVIIVGAHDVLAKSSFSKMDAQRGGSGSFRGVHVEESISKRAVSLTLTPFPLIHSMYVSCYIQLGGKLA